jgi:hypothetical protein
MIQELRASEPTLGVFDEVVNRYGPMADELRSVFPTRRSLEDSYRSALALPVDSLLTLEPSQSAAILTVVEFSRSADELERLLSLRGAWPF